MLENNDDDIAAVDDDDANKLTLPRAFTRSSMCLGQFLTLPPTSGELLNSSIPQCKKTICKFVGSADSSIPQLLNSSM